VDRWSSLEETYDEYRAKARSRNAAHSSSSIRMEGDNLPWQKLRILMQLAMQKTAEKKLTGTERLKELQRLIDTH
jgi:hypothetical protein